MNNVLEYFRDLPLIIRAILLIVVGLVTILILIQLVPYGRDHDNPPVRQEPSWDSPQTRAFAVRSCFDCHSNESRWPLYSSIAPLSWMLQRNVALARGEFNFSEWDRWQGGEDFSEIPDEVLHYGMPTCDYLWLHPDATLTADERLEFVRGLQATLGVTDQELVLAGSDRGFFRCARDTLIFEARFWGIDWRDFAFIWLGIFVIVAGGFPLFLLRRRLKSD